MKIKQIVENFGEEKIEIETSQGTLFIEMNKENLEVYLVNANDCNDEVVRFRANRIHEVGAWRNGRLKASASVCNPYIRTWLGKSSIHLDFVTYKQEVEAAQ